jgi:hypothetical protein
MSIGWHGSIDRLGIHHVKLLKHIMGVLHLANKSSMLHLLDLKSEEELQFTHHGHLKSLGHDPTKFLTKIMISTTKYYVIDIYLAHKYIFTNFTSEMGRINFAYFKALFEQEFLRAFIPCSWCLLKPIERLLEFVNIVGELGIFKTRWLLNIDKFLNRAIEEYTLHIHLI